VTYPDSTGCAEGVSGNSIYGKNVFRAVDYSDLPDLTLQAIREPKAANDQLCEEVEQFKQ